MRIIEIEQNSPQWEEMRRSRIGASDIAIIMTGSKKDVYELYLNKVSGKRSFVTAAMQRGHDMEAEARAWVNMMQGRDFEPLVAESETHPWLMASFDGWDELGSLEIKCPKKVEDFLEDHYSFEKWFWQVQAQMAVGGQDQVLIVVYSEQKQVYGYVARDEEAIKKLLKESKAFYDRVANYDPPEDELPERTDAGTLELVARWKEAKEALNNAEAIEEELRQKLVDAAGDTPFKAGGVSVTKAFRKGAIEYKQIVALKDIDLEKYRKGAVAFWKVAPAPRG